MHTTWRVVIKKGRHELPVLEGRQRLQATKVFRSLSVALDALRLTCRLQLWHGQELKEEYIIDHTKVQ